MALLLGGSGVGMRLTAGTCRGGGRGGSITASGAVTVTRSGGGGGGANAILVGGLWAAGVPAEGTTGAGTVDDEVTPDGSGGGKGAGLLVGRDALRVEPQVWSAPRQWQHKFVCKKFIYCLN